MTMRPIVSRRGVLAATLGSFVTSLLGRRRASAAPAELTLPGNPPAARSDFATSGIDRWRVIDGQWAVEDMNDAPSGKRVLVQRAVKNDYNVIVAPSGPYTDVDVSVKFTPISGREDASGGIVFRFSDGRYYVLRANELEDNFRLYTYDKGRRQIATARVKPRGLGQWHTIRAVVVGTQIQGWLNGRLLIDQHDTRFRAGRVGLWTKADSVTAFDDLTIRGA